MLRRGHGSDAALLVRELAENEVEFERVESAQEMLALREREWDLAILDYNLPSFGALDALALVQKEGSICRF